MKKAKLFLMLTLYGGVSLVNAQNERDYLAKAIKVEDITKTMSKGRQPGFKVEIYQTIKDDAEKAWSKTIKKGKVSVENIANEIFVLGSSVESISAAPINIYSIFNGYKDYVELVAFFEVDNTMLTKSGNESAYLAAKIFVRDFAISSYRDAVEKEVKLEEKELKDLEKELKKLINENEKMHKKVGEEERNIENNKNEIKTNELDQNGVRGQIQGQKDQLYKLKDEEQKDAAEKVLKGYEKDLSKLIKGKEKMHKSIDNSEKKIREYQRNIEDGKLDIKRMQFEVSKQEEHLRKIEKKLENID